VFTAVWIADRRRRTGPSVHDLVEVLGRENLYGMLGRESGANRVRPGVSLAPGGALFQVAHPRGVEAHVWIAVNPQHRPLSIGHHDDALRVARRFADVLSNQGGHCGQRMNLPACRHIVSISHRGCNTLYERVDPASCDRSHDAAIGPRRSADSLGPAVAAPAMKRSQARRTSRARTCGGVVASIASQGFAGRMYPAFWAQVYGSDRGRTTA
jgi:hypothetical protein